jgi:hypothetical protein
MRFVVLPLVLTTFSCGKRREKDEVKEGEGKS